MIEREHFSKTFKPDLHVAALGISRDEWYCHKPGMTKEEVKQTMVTKRYDVVPIINNQGIPTSYFYLKNFNQPDEIVINKILPEDRLYYLTNVRDAIWKMASDQRSFYFLTNGRNVNDMVGLFTLSDFNCREFYVFVFNLISYVEREFGQIITLSKEVAINELEKLAQNNVPLTEQLKLIKDRISEDEAKNIENDYKEYLYLHHLISLVKIENKYKDLGYKHGDDFENGTSYLRAIRNNIAHPVKSLVKDLAGLSDLEKGINKLYEFKLKLDDFTKLKM